MRKAYSGLTEDQRSLAELMSETSEDAYCAGWLKGTEYRLWQFLVDPQDDGRWGNITLSPGLRRRLRELADRIDGWIVYVGGPDRPVDAWGEEFIAMKDWLLTYEEAETAWRRSLQRPRRFADFLAQQ